MSSEAGVTEDDRRKLDGLLRFAHGILTARDKVQMSLSSGLGVYHEGAVAKLPGVHLDEADGAWLRIDRLRETKPPVSADYVAEFISSKGADLERRPELRPALAKEVTIEEASDLIEAGLLRPENVRSIVERSVEVLNRVQVTLLAEDCQEMCSDFETWRDGAWADWASTERPIRKSIAFYHSLFQLNSAIHAAESVPPELVWGTGIGRWKTEIELIDMPLLEQLVDIEVEVGGTIAIRPRDLPPSISLKPYIQIEVAGAAKLQNQLKDTLATVLTNESDFSPFSPSGWEHILAVAAAQLSGSATLSKRADIEAGANLQSASVELAVTSTWVIYGRPRSSEARSQDLEALRAAICNPEVPVPKSIKGFASPEPDEPKGDTDPFGLNLGILATGGATNTWTAPESQPTSAKRSLNLVDTDDHATHFFPLPFNEEQSAIIKFLDDPDRPVVTVTGPPGTGKTHTIANIISHSMATGRRVLVTARTPEAIAAVREKLPESLRSLVIASVGTDQESAQQLRDAVSELSDEVISLNVADADARRRRLESQIVECDKETLAAQRQLAEIARHNLAPLTWTGEPRAVMDLVEDLTQQTGRYGWFTDSPTGEPPAQLNEVLQRLRLTLPRLAPDIAYAGVPLPDPADLPTTADLIAAHHRELAWITREIPDYSKAAAMARDTADVEQEAHALLSELEDCARCVRELAEYQARIAAHIAGDSKSHGVGEAAFRQAVTYMARFRSAADAAAVRFHLGRTSIEDLVAAAERGAAGQKPIPFTALFNAALKETIASVKIDGRAPAAASDWMVVHAACKIHFERVTIESTLAPVIGAQLLPPLPNSGWEIALYLQEKQTGVEAALAIARRLAGLRGQLASLFPFGLDLDLLCTELRTEDAIHALRANLPTDFETSAALSALDAIAGESDLQVFRMLRELRGRLGTKEIDPQEIVAVRGDLTREFSRLAMLKPDLARLVQDLGSLEFAGAPDWVRRLKTDPLDAPTLIPDDWGSAWTWGIMKGRVNRIIALGNGDQHRRAKADALLRRGMLFEELIRTRTLLGLHQRMQPSVKRALLAFTEAVAKIGKGTGKSAPRFRLAAQEAAKRASSAAPVWVIPEYKIPEQLPPELGDFDLVILDEASQSDITALAALLRGKSILVVGDEEQVSPSNVAVPVQRINALRADCLIGLPNASLIDENASIFEIARRMHPDTHVILKEHFRCVAPIIQFSTQFYANRLVPLRVPKASERFDPPLVDVFIKGALRQGQTNPSEARYIVNEIAGIVANPAHEHRDICVISLIGNEQADKIERMLIEDSRIGTEKITAYRIICGDARTMQGQERSIVFLSMVATPGNAHAQTKKADQQRINVAMSRARDRLYLVRSVSLDDLSPIDIKAKVLKHFREPMPEGRNPLASGASEDLFAKCQSGFEREVLRLLLEANYRVRPQVKVGAFSIDLVVEGGEDRRLAIELDGDAYHGPEVWERDMARQAALERAGWNFWRVFGSQWNAQRDYWWRDLTHTLDQMGIGPIGFEKLDERFTEFRTVDPFLADPGGSSESTTTPQVHPVEREPISTDTSSSCYEDSRTKQVSPAPSATDAIAIDSVEAPASPARRPHGEVPGTAGLTESRDEESDYGNDHDDVDDEQQSGATPDGLGPVASHPPLSPSPLVPAVGSPVVSTSILPSLGIAKNAVAAADLDSFYDPTYRPQIRELAAKLIDAEGPITFKRLSDLIARAHGFQRTGKEISSVVWAACQQLRRYLATPDGHKVFWPENVEPREQSPFRGMILNGGRREWREIPHPEKISLIREVLDAVSEADLARAIGERVGIVRVTTQFRAEIAALKRHLEP